MILYSLVSLRITLAAFRAPVDLLHAIALEALETGLAVLIGVAVTLANLALVPRSAATDAEVVQSRGVVAVVLTQLS